MSAWYGSVYVTVYLVIGGSPSGGADEEAVAAALERANAASRANGDDLTGALDGHHIGPHGEPALVITLLTVQAPDSSQSEWDAIHRAFEQRWPAAERFAAELRSALGARFGVDLTSEVV